MAEDQIKITFLGTGTSQGVPVIACDCKVCKSSDEKDKRLRSSILIETQGKTICIDSGPDFRQQMLRADVQKLDAIVYTHEHKDHTAGMDDVRAFNFKHKSSMDLYVDENVEAALRREYSYVFATKTYPGIPQINLHKIEENKSFNVHGVEFTPIRLMHYKLPIFGFRVGDFAYCTDVNLIPQSEFQKLKGLKVLVITALRKEKHISHFNLSEALEVIHDLQPEKAYLTHISHLLGKHSEVEKELPSNVQLSYDGFSVLI